MMSAQAPATSPIPSGNDSRVCAQRLGYDQELAGEQTEWRQRGDRDDARRERQAEQAVRGDQAGDIGEFLPAL